MGECSVCANLRKSETDKQAIQNARTVSTLQTPDFDITHFLRCVKKARNPISSPDVCISSSRSSYIGITYSAHSRGSKLHPKVEPIISSVNKAFWCIIIPIYLCIIYFCFQMTPMELTTCDRDAWPTKPSSLIDGEASDVAITLTFILLTLCLPSSPRSCPHVQAFSNADKTL